MIRQPATLVVALFAALNLSAQDEPKLGKGDIKTLNRSAASWVEAQIEYDTADSERDRLRRGEAALKARQKFESDLEKKSKKFDVLGSMADLRAIFAGTIPFDRVSTSGEPKMITADPNDAIGQTHVLVAPRRYSPGKGYTTVVALPTWDEDAGEWVRATKYFESTWDGSSLRDDAIIAVPELDAAVEMESIIPSDAPNARDVQRGRFNTVLGTVASVKSTYNVDFDRVFLDTGKGASAFALRFATYFPQFFAGLVVRHPVDVTDEVRLGSLIGMPVLLVATPDTQAACDKLAAALNELQDGACTVLEGKGAYPFAESQADIDAWVSTQRRDLLPAHVVCEPNHDALNDAYWVKIGRAEPLASLPLDQRPRLEVKADREANRIDITARNVQDLVLLLNDDIVDLEQPFTVVINGVAVEERRQRSLTDMFEQMLKRRDPSYLFTAEFKALVPGK